MGLRELAKAGGARCATSRAARRSEAGARGGAGLLSSAAAEGAARSGARWHPQKPAAAPYSVTRLAGAPPAAARPVEERGETQATLGGKGVPSGGAVRRSRPTAAHARRLQQRRWPDCFTLGLQRLLLAPLPAPPRAGGSAPSFDSYQRVLHAPRGRGRDRRRASSASVRRYAPDQAWAPSCSRRRRHRQSRARRRRRWPSGQTWAAS